MRRTRRELVADDAALSPATGTGRLPGARSPWRRASRALMSRFAAIVHCSEHLPVNGSPFRATLRKSTSRSARAWSSRSGAPAPSTVTRSRALRTEARRSADRPLRVSFTLIALERCAARLARARPSTCGRRPAERSSAETRQAEPQPARTVSRPARASARSDSAGTIAKSGAVLSAVPMVKVTGTDTPVLPAASACSARAVHAPSVRVAGSVDQAPLPASRGTAQRLRGQPRRHAAAPQLHRDGPRIPGGQPTSTRQLRPRFSHQRRRGADVASDTAGAVVSTVQLRSAGLGSRLSA